MGLCVDPKKMILPSRIQLHLFRLSPLALAFLLATAGPLRSQDTDINPDQVASQAFRHLKEGELDKAERLFRWIRDGFPASPRVVEALLGLAEVEAARGRAESARDLFSAFLLNFPSHPLAPRARFKLGNLELALEADEKAHRYRNEQPMRGAQILVVEGHSPAMVERSFRRLKELGIDTVIIRAFHNPGDRYHPMVPKEKQDGRTGVYFRTHHSPVVEDLLPVYAELARQNGMKIYAWMTTRYADYGFAIDDPRYDSIYDLGQKELIRDKGLDIWNPAVERYLSALFEDLARNPIDGILFQDDLVYRHTTGFGASARKRYQSEFGMPLKPENLYRGIYQVESGKHYVREYTPEFWQWVDWKNRKILSLASSLSAAARKIRPDLKIALNFFYEAVTQPRNALAWISQSISRAEEGPFDYYAVMAYHRQMASELSLNTEKTTQLLGKMTADLYRRVEDRSRIMLKLQVRDWDTREKVTPAEFTRLMSTVRSSVPAGASQPSIVLVPVDSADDAAIAGFPSYQTPGH